MMRPTLRQTVAAVAGRSHWVAGVMLAVLWAFSAGAFGVVGRAYFYLVRLNDSMKPVGLQVLLHPVFLCAGALFIARGRTPSTAKRGTSHGMAAGLVCWIIGATFSALFHAGTEGVALTYCSVFVAGAAIYFALARMEVQGRVLEIALVGLALGSLMPLVGGIQAFQREWGGAEIQTTLSAYKNLLRMELYEGATFGSRGNTATFVIIIAPLFLWTALDRSRGWLVRTICTALLIPIVMNVLILQIRAAFIALLFAIAAVFGFKLGLRRYPIFAVGLAVAVLLLVRYSPEISDTMSDRLRPILTLDTIEDASVMERAASIDEGLSLARRNWLLGIGPGASLKRHSQTAAHQFEVQEFMEIGVLGLIASSLFSIGVLIMLVRTLARGQDLGVNNTRFALLIGPATFVIYGTFSNPTLNVGYINTWVVLIASMVALTPRFEVSAARRRLGTI
jgi:hypothetical protein